jgi:transcriptional regulator with XRE-family HTH domain
MATGQEVTPTELREIREAFGLTQDALADELGVHRVTVARWEAGDRGIPEPVARLIERIRLERLHRLATEILDARKALNAGKRVLGLSALADALERLGAGYRHHANAIRRAGDETVAGRRAVDTQLTMVLSKLDKES